VPGAAGRGAGIAAISCSPAGYCGAGGSAGDGKRGSDGHAFVVTERGGAWSAARPAPAGDGDSAVTLMSCASPLACTAAGYDDGGSGIFVTSTAAR
ncbi:MAG: hypothetical protein J2P25_19245, partial [Nocardiopsaceae bacterium]|nr:hypothetical protein [Nocardiopsaceae bacterium]